MPTASHHRARVLGTVGAGTAHGALALIGYFDLLNYTVPTTYRLIDEVASERAWVWIHAAVALLMFASLLNPYAGVWPNGPRRATIAASLGFAMMLTWAFFNLLWGLSAERPVSLAGPVLAFAVAAGEQILANAWMRGTQTKVR